LRDYTSNESSSYNPKDLAYPSKALPISPKVAVAAALAKKNSAVLKATGKHCIEADSKRIAMGLAMTLDTCNKRCNADKTCVEFAYKASYN